jgi:hypothetical protein
MAITLNANTAAFTTLGGRLTLPGGAPVPSPPSAPPPPAPLPVAPSPVTPATIAVNPALTTLFPPLIRPPIFIPPPVQNKTATQLANGAITQLNGVAPASVTQAINAIRSKSLDGPGLIPYLERKIRIGEALNQLAKDWTAATRTDFADAFSMDANNLNNDVSDSIVSIAILNDRDLTGEILAENTPPTSPNDLTDTRKIVWQSVPPGTPLNPPYVLLVAVEYQNIATAEDVVKSITSQLGTTASGFKLPQAVIQKGVN